MKIYLAAKYERHPELNGYKERLEGMGHKVTSRWLNTAAYENVPLAECAQADLVDIERSDLLIAFTGGEKSAGRHVEFGYALALRKEAWVVGPTEGCFYMVPDVLQFDDFDALLGVLGRGF